MLKADDPQRFSDKLQVKQETESKIVIQFGNVRPQDLPASPQGKTYDVEELKRLQNASEAQAQTPETPKTPEMP